MATWTKQKLGDIAEMKYGKMPSKKKVGLGNYKIFSGYRYFDAYPESNCKKGDVIIVARGVGGTGDIKISKCDCYLTNLSIKILLDQTQVNNRYFYYKYLLSTLRYLDSGSAQSQITINDLEKLQVNLPDLPTQTCIASVLSAYDDLIENNEKRINALEEMAQLLYTEWFVKFKFPGHEKVKMVESGTEYEMMPEGWEVKNVESLIKRIPVGKKYENKSVFETGKVPVLDQGKTGLIGYHNDEPGVKASVENPVIVFANHTCYQNIIMYPFSAIQNVLPFIPNDKRDIFWLNWATKDLIKFNDYKGHWPEFMAKKLVVPPADLTKIFGVLVGKYVALRYELEMKNKNLSKNRDLLIPQLVTGKRELK
ncbi:restriction endonuclease subunit S [Candidatus Uhrbacteria bacterium]|nr:restriction endonuclease subunit S [Candidatus Uhrbacteria bacterium]